MTDHDFQDRILEALSGIESRLEKRLDSMEALRKEDNERLEKRLEFMETHTSQVRQDVGQLRQDVGWIKGKLEGNQESSSRILVVFSTGAAIAAVIIALIALFN